MDGCRTHQNEKDKYRFPVITHSLNLINDEYEKRGYKTYITIPVWINRTQVIAVRLVDRRRTAGGASQGGCRRREVWTEYLDTRQRVDLVGKLILKEFRKNWGIALS